eukprot:TRINITY_DN40637_c0_g1_i2.p1 TRINITY_DN40637_c0_g1~~TRINITY_DN40637_c0_g1_i2.p1  ORF type:complete len:764 (-),score=121.10 TRINITY_DN40637_c0_g1_i2:244-2496(-)
MWGAGTPTQTPQANGKWPWNPYMTPQMWMYMMQQNYATAAQSAQAQAQAQAQGQQQAQPAVQGATQQAAASPAPVAAAAPAAVQGTPQAPPTTATPPVAPWAQVQQMQQMHGTGQFPWMPMAYQGFQQKQYQAVPPPQGGAYDANRTGQYRAVPKLAATTAALVAKPAAKPAKIVTTHFGVPPPDIEVIKVVPAKPKPKPKPAVSDSNKTVVTVTPPQSLWAKPGTTAALGAGAKKAAKAKPKPVDDPGYPESLRNFVQRALDMTVGNEKLTRRTEKWLKRLLVRTREDRSLWGHPWEKEPLPRFLLRGDASSSSSDDEPNKKDAGSPARGGARGGATGRGQARKSRRSGWDSPEDEDPAAKRSKPDSDSDSDASPLVIGARGRGRGRGIAAGRTALAAKPASDDEEESAQKKKAKKAAKGKQEGEAWGFKMNEDPAKKMQRMNRFTPKPQPKAASWRPAVTPVKSAPPCDFGDGNDLPAVEGLSEALEKPYLRLTQAPDPATVRTEAALRKALKFILEKSKEKKEPYTYLWEQLKSIRQDLTVQRITNQFTVEVYETAARLALQYEDRGEFNQCQANLKWLYEQGVVVRPESVPEFKAYLIMYNAFLNSFADLTSEMESVTEELSSDEAVMHALKVADAWLEGNYVRLSKLYVVAPNMGKELMDLFQRERCLRIYPRLLKPFRPYPMPLDYLRQLLYPGREALSDPAQDPLMKFLAWVNAVTVNGELETKASFTSFLQFERSLSTQQRH